MTTMQTQVAPKQVTVAPGVEDWAGRAAPLLPLIADAAKDIDESGRLREDVLAAMHDIGLFRLLVPHELGGGQVTPAQFVEVVETIARADASTAWVLSQCSICSMAVAYLPYEAGMDIVGNDPDALLAWGALPAGEARREGSGWRISGKWFFASGSRHATWMGGRCPLVDPDGKPILNDKGEPDVRMFLFPKDAVDVNYAWDVIGLRGTGSDSYSVTDLFVPDDRQFDVNVRAGHPGLLYRIVNRHLFAPGVAAVSLGVSRALLDEFANIARDERKGLSRSEAILSELGWMEARWRSVRTYLYAALDKVWDGILQGGTETVEDQIEVRCASTLAVHEAKRIADFCFHEAGAAVILNSLPFERRMRDFHAITQHGQSKRSNMETVGKYVLGMDPGDIIL